MGNPNQDSQLINLTASEATRLIAAGTITSEALVSACLARIAERDPGIRAWAHLDMEKALNDARRADAWRATGQGLGPLHGVPIGIKDIIDTEDYPTENGCPIYTGNQPRKDALCVTALRAAGAIVLGKTITTELALLTPAETKNPVAPEHSPGGSSAGSAAAVSDFMVPAALGTQTAGSVLRPASYTGIYGFKPTYGLIPRSGVLMQSHTLDTVGLLARSMDDIALLSDAMSWRDPDDETSYSRSQTRLFDLAQTQPPVTPNFAFVRTPSWDQVDTDSQAAFEELAEELGEACTTVDLPSLDRVIEWQRLVQLAENAAYYGPLQDDARDQLSDGLNARLDEGAKVPVRSYLEAVASREKACAALDELFEDFTAIITPASPGTPPNRSEGITGSPIFNGLWTYLGMPCLSIPLLEVNGLPVGVQLIAQRRDDGRLLRTARWLIDHLADEQTPPSTGTVTV
ncbi:MAG: amidase [Pseudomonadota bacterium]